MYQEFQYFLQQLHDVVEKQEQRIQALEGTVAQLKSELEELKDKPKVNVEKIEYRFDQLKVETLEGTLNIGLNPSELQGIDSLEINQSGGQPPNNFPDPKGLFRDTVELEEEVYNILETELPSLVANAEARVNQKLDEQYIDFIKEDIKMQVPTRVQHHIRNNSFSGNEQERDSWKHSIVQKLLKEMENGICTFISNLPNNMKGMKNE